MLIHQTPLSVVDQQKVLHLMNQHQMSLILTFPVWAGQVADKHPVSRQTIPHTSRRWLALALLA
jgi:hypothetical protein